MKRGFDDFEIFDEEWDKHYSTFKPSCVLKKPRTLTPRPIESFDFRSSPKPQQLYDKDENFDCVEIKPELEDNDSDCVVINEEWAPGIIVCSSKLLNLNVATKPTLDREPELRNLRNPASR
ncbi:hypothetical protein ACFX2J_014248 [Malus domestica]